MNTHSKKLSQFEAEQMKNDPGIRELFLVSYKLILNFFGISLVNSTTGDVVRDSHFHERYENLETSPHNYLRITRILKSLGELGFPHFKLPLIEHWVIEMTEHKRMHGAVRSLLNFWIPTLPEQERENFIRKITDNGKLDILKDIAKPFQRPIQKPKPLMRKQTTVTEPSKASPSKVAQKPSTTKPSAPKPSIKDMIKQKRKELGVTKEEKKDEIEIYVGYVAAPIVLNTEELQEIKDDDVLEDELWQTMVYKNYAEYIMKKSTSKK